MEFHSFKADQSGETAVRTALYFAGLAIAGALVLAPAAEKVSQQLAYGGKYGIDPTTTASVPKPAKRYTIRKSILD